MKEAERRDCLSCWQKTKKTRPGNPVVGFVVGAGGGCQISAGAEGRLQRLGETDHVAAVVVVVVVVVVAVLVADLVVVAAFALVGPLL